MSFAKKSSGAGADVLETNDYYAFGMNHLGTDNITGFGQGAYENYKYNGKELQETGFLDYGWRQYMPELGRWFGMDQLSESYLSTSPYAYVLNSPVMNSDADGRYTLFKVADTEAGGGGGGRTDPQGGLPTAHIHTGAGSGVNWGNLSTWGNDDGEPPGGSLWGGIKSLYNKLFGIGKSNAQITTVLPGAEVTRKPLAWVGEMEFMNDREGADWSKVPTIDLPSPFQGKSTFDILVVDTNPVMPAIASAIAPPLGFLSGTAQTVNDASEGNYFGAAIGVISLGASAKMSGDAYQWYRKGPSYSHEMEMKTISHRWGASPKYLNKIPHPMMQKLNQYFRKQKLPFGDNLQRADPGHYHIDPNF